MSDITRIDQSAPRGRARVSSDLVFPAGRMADDHRDRGAPT